VEKLDMNNQAVKWKIYIVGHKKIHEDLTRGDKRFNNHNYTFLNVGQMEKLENSEKYNCLNQRELPNYISIGKCWAESEGIYNIWRSRSYKELRYIGFLHYDIEFRLTRRFCPWGSTNITQRIEKYICRREKAHISFATFNTAVDYAQKIMMDPARPNELTGNGINCYDQIMADYNRYFNTNYTMSDFFAHKHINLCSCFLMDVATYDKMMAFFDWLVTSHKLDVYDTAHLNRFQGGMAERYFGVFLLFEYEKMLDLSLVHQYDRGWK
jgi:hypothetical protein